MLRYDPTGQRRGDLEDCDSVPTAAPDSPSPTIREGKPRLDSIDMLRAVAVTAVFALHVRGFWIGDDAGVRGLAFVVDRVAAQGAAGVDLFIVLSGFCMTYPLVRGRTDVAKISAVRFYRRRAIRLFPAYYAALAILIALLLVPPLQRALVARPIAAWDVIAHALFIQPFSPNTLPSINGPLWSISLEVTLYLVFPLTLIILNKFGWSWMIGGSLLAAVGWFSLIDTLGASSDPQGLTSVMQYWLPGHYFEFVLGMLAADMVCRPRRRQQLAAIITLPCAALVGAAGTAAGSSVIRTLGWGIAAFALTIVAAGRSTGRLHTSFPRITAVGTRLGLVSYSFYLLHQPIVLLIGAVVRDLGLPPLMVYSLALPAGMTVVYFVARAFFLIVERPFLLAGSMRNAIRSEECQRL